MNLLLYGLVALTLMAAVAKGVYSLKEWGADEVRLDWQKSVAELRKREEKKAAKAAEDLEVAYAKSRVFYRTITREVDRIINRDVYRNVCLDPDGLRLANWSLLGQIGPPPELDQPLPAPKPTPGRDGGGGPAQDPGSERGLLRVRGEAPGAR